MQKPFSLLLPAQIHEQANVLHLNRQSDLAFSLESYRLALFDFLHREAQLNIIVMNTLELSFVITRRNHVQEFGEIPRRRLFIRCKFFRIILFKDSSHYAL